MTNKITLAGIHLTLKFSKKMNEAPISLNYTSSEPVVNIYKSTNRNSYIVNIISFIPIKLQNLTDDLSASGVLTSGLFLNDDKSIFLNYAGVNNINTSINTMKDDGNITCRVFNIIYDHENKMEDQYNLYHTQFEYSLLSNNFQSVEGVIVHDINVDPETDRGTVTTVRIDKQ